MAPDLLPDQNPAPLLGLRPATARFAVICQPPGSPLDPLISALLEQGAHLHVVPLRHLPLDWFDRYANSYDMALIDAEFLGDKIDMIDFGMRLRRFAPDLPIIMLSTRVSAPDFTTERMAFCDVTLRLPVSETTLFESLSIALENHAYWRDSRFESRLLAPRNRPRPPPPPAA